MTREYYSITISYVREQINIPLTYYFVKNELIKPEILAPGLDSILNLFSRRHRIRVMNPHIREERRSDMLFNHQSPPEAVDELLENTPDGTVFASHDLVVPGLRYQYPVHLKFDENLNLIKGIDLVLPYNYVGLTRPRFD